LTFACQPFVFFQHARERSRITVKASGGAFPRSPGWSSLMSSVGLYMQYSKRTSARPKSYKSPLDKWLDDGSSANSSSSSTCTKAWWSNGCIMGKEIQNKTKNFGGKAL